MMLNLQEWIWNHYRRNKFAQKVIPLVNLNNVDYNNRCSLTSKDVPRDNQWTYQQRNMNFDKDLNLKGLYCHHPFNTITVDGNGDVFVCTCQTWLPVSVGNILDFNSLADIVRSPKAREIQASIIDGSYRYCDHNSCSIIKENQLKNRVDHNPDNVTFINFSVDYSCNLSCPSCRSEVKFVDNQDEFLKRVSIMLHLAELIETHDLPIKFGLAGDGDPFASIIYRKFLEMLDTNQNKNKVEIELATNGILISDHWLKFKNIHKSIVRLKISFDAGSEEIYNITRRGGNWNKLIKSVKYIQNWRRENRSDMALTSNFVVQTSNYKDMITYVNLCNDLGFDEINFQKIDNWGTFSNFDEHAIWKGTHPLHNEFLQYISSPQLSKNNKVNLTNLSHFKNEIK